MTERFEVSADDGREEGKLSVYHNDRKLRGEG